MDLVSRETPKLVRSTFSSSFSLVAVAPAWLVDSVVLGSDLLSLCGHSFLLFEPLGLRRRGCLVADCFESHRTADP